MVSPLVSPSFPEDVVIASAASLSAAVNMSGYVLCGVQMPAAWTTANLTFQGSSDGSTFYDMYDDAGTEITVTAAASQFIGFGALSQNFFAPKHLKVRSGATGAPVNQGAERTVTLILGNPAT